MSANDGFRRRAAPHRPPHPEHRGGAAAARVRPRAAVQHRRTSAARTLISAVGCASPPVPRPRHAVDERRQAAATSGCRGSTARSDSLPAVQRPSQFLVGSSRTDGPCLAALGGDPFSGRSSGPYSPALRAVLQARQDPQLCSRRRRMSHGGQGRTGAARYGSPGRRARSRPWRGVRGRRIVGDFVQRSHSSYTAGSPVEGDLEGLLVPAAQYSRTAAVLHDLRASAVSDAALAGDIFAFRRCHEGVHRAIGWSRRDLAPIWPRRRSDDRGGVDAEGSR